MSSVTSKQARQHWSELMGAVERGASFVITRRGKKVARLLPVREKRSRGLPDLTEFRQSISLKGPSLTDELLAQRREERY